MLGGRDASDVARDVVVEGQCSRQSGANFCLTRLVRERDAGS